MTDIGEVSDQFKAIAELFGIKKRVGFEAAVIAECEQKIGRLPAVLRDYYLELGAHEPLNQTQDRLFNPNELRKVSDYIIFYIENQGACEWGIQKADWVKSDPPVYRSYDRTEWTPESDSLSEFLSAMAHWQAVFAYKYSCEEFLTVSPQTAEKIRSSFQSKELKGFQYWDTEIFCWKNAIIILLQNGEDYDLFYAAPIEEDFSKLDELIDKILEE